MTRKRHLPKNEPERTPKNYEERRQELIEALYFLNVCLYQFQRTNFTVWAKAIAGKLRALIIYVEGSGSLCHPLLLDLAKEKNYPLMVYVNNIAWHETIGSFPGLPNPMFSFSGNIFSLSPWEGFTIQVPLAEALGVRYVKFEGEDITYKMLIRDVAETEDVHYDPGRPERLTRLHRLEISDMSSAYVALYELGSIVWELGNQFIEATAPTIID